MDIGLLIIRAIVGLTLVAHGGQILFGWDGPGLRATGRNFESLGYRPGTVFALLSGATDLCAGGCFTLGLLTPLAGAAIVANMLSAVLSAHVRNGFWIVNQGLEYALVMAAVGLAVAFTGAGQLSVDRMVGWSLSGNAWGVFALVAGLLAALAVELYRRRNLKFAAPAPAEFDESEKRAA
jgi:putative oxidoreductase